MGSRCGSYVFWSRIYSALICLWGIRSCWSLNDEVMALLKFRARIDYDPRGALANWKPDDLDPCDWLGVQCVDNTVQMLNLSELSLEGTLAPELGKLSNLKYLVLCKNKFSGTIPKEFGELTKLELLDLRDNCLTGSVAAEIGRMLFLKDFNIEVNVPQDLGKHELLSKRQLIDNHTSHEIAEIGCMNRKIGHCVRQSNFKLWNMRQSLVIPIKGAITKCLNSLALPLFKLQNYHNNYEDNCFDNQPSESAIAQNLLDKFKRRKLLDQSSNLVAAPFSGGSAKQIISLPSTLSSGAFPATLNTSGNHNQSPTPLPSPASSGNEKNRQPSAEDNASGDAWKYIIIILGVLLLVIVAVAVFCLWNKRAVKAIRPWKTGLSGQLQKAFVTGVPKLNRAELEVACEDFSNIVTSLPHCTVYKGTLSSGVEIAVASAMITSAQDWSKNMEIAYRKMIDTMSRVNHKNFINLIGYCEEEEPFTRMMVTEYAPNGSLFEHLHVEGLEHLDWNSRMRVIMGVAYCLQYMHHDLNPSVAHSNLDSHSVLLTDDFAAKIAQVIFASSLEDKSISKNSELTFNADPETDVYCFGKLLFEIISGKLPDCEEQKQLEKLAGEFSNGKRSISNMIDPSLESFREKELDVVCEVIHECTQPNPSSRPTMKDITSKLRNVIGMSPDQAAPRLSPLWWAELEILSEEAT
ncbi:protein MALE DISCOVERER 2-like isoform X2 [Prosopis cineraria]|uniref:protein MALE DISCOVERER 2-like isoform X2 n=1 Tax=Prosopis cineraria TaxID=364024 RepID=UPI002410AC20|nr:protein MALE DISCOVERER 2-like isoform X2 [Prosopis cineraria]